MAWGLDLEPRRPTILDAIRKKKTVWWMAAQELAASGIKHREVATTVVTFGTFDMFHIGHLNLLQRARHLGAKLVVGVSTDALNLRKKGRAPLCPQQDRAAIVAALACVSEVFYEHALEYKRTYLLEHGADVLVMGDDWAGRFDEFQDICRVVYLARTADISTTELIVSAAQRHADAGLTADGAYAAPSVGDAAALDAQASRP